jgi:hypothetical protein
MEHLASPAELIIVSSVVQQISAATAFLDILFSITSAINARFPTAILATKTINAINVPVDISCLTIIASLAQFRIVKHAVKIIFVGLVPIHMFLKVLEPRANVQIVVIWSQIHCVSVLQHLHNLMATAIVVQYHFALYANNKVYARPALLHLFLLLMGLHAFAQLATLIRTIIVYVQLAKFKATVLASLAQSPTARCVHQQQLASNAPLHGQCHKINYPACANKPVLFQERLASAPQTIYNLIMYVTYVTYQIVYHAHQTTSAAAARIT